MQSGQRRVTAPAAALWALGIVGLFALLVAGFVVASVHAAPGNSDGATVILEGHAFAGGNVMLNHWALSLDSFWLVDVPVYALAVAIGGVRPELLHLVPAVTAAFVVLLGAWMAVSPVRRRRRSAAIAGAAVVVTMLGLPTHALAQFFLMGPLHVVTTLWCMVAFVALRRARFGWGWALAVVLLAAGMLGDLQAVILGVAPVVIAGLLLAARTRSIRVGLPGVTAGLGAVLLAKLVRVVADAIGTFGISVNPRPGLHQMAQNAIHLPRYGASLFGFGVYPFGGPPIPRALEALHGLSLLLALVAVVAGVVSVVAGVVRGSDRAASSEDLSAGTPAAAPGAMVAGAEEGRRSLIEERWLSDVVLAGAFAGCVTYVVLPLTSSGAYGRYLTAAVVFATILTGRFVANALDWLLAQDTRRMRLGLAAAVLVGALVVSAQAASFSSAVTTPPPRQNALRLVRFLDVHHLDHGLGDYWSSSIVTVESRGQIVVRPIIGLTGHIGRYLRQSDSRWYDRRFQFLVFNTRQPWGRVNTFTVVFSFGHPVRIDAIGPYRVYQWSHPISVPDH